MLRHFQSISGYPDRNLKRSKTWSDLFEQFARTASSDLKTVTWRSIPIVKHLLNVHGCLSDSKEVGVESHVTSCSVTIHVLENTSYIR